MKKSLFIMNKNNKIKDKNIVDDNNEVNINTSDVFKCFNYLYQQKSQ